jgi:transcriptional regulator with XRE-family HTH domain
MASYVDIEQLSAMVRAKRGDAGLRQTAEEIGSISPSTLSRVENGKLPDMDTFLRLCDWLVVDPGQFLRNTNETEEPQMKTAEIVEAHLRADKELNPETAEALATMVKAAYKAVRAGKVG